MDCIGDWLFVFVLVVELCLGVFSVSSWESCLGLVCSMSGLCFVLVFDVRSYILHIYIYNIIYYYYYLILFYLYCSPFLIRSSFTFPLQIIPLLLFLPVLPLLCSILFHSHVPSIPYLPALIYILSISSPNIPPTFDPACFIGVDG